MLTLKIQEHRRNLGAETPGVGEKGVLGSAYFTENAQTLD